MSPTALARRFEQWMTIQFRFTRFPRHVRRDAPRILAIGCGNRGYDPVFCKQLFPDCHVVGIDMVDFETYRPEIASQIDRYYRIDLNEEDLSKVTETDFDVVLASHVLEHLYRPYDILDQALAKLADGGIVYIEYPRFASTRFPSMKGRGTLNFWDEPTHYFILSMREVLNLLNRHHLAVLEFGVRRFWRRIVLFPAGLVYSLVKHGEIRPGNFWDVLGFAEYAIACNGRSAPRHQ